MVGSIRKDMNILALAKMDEKDDYLFDFVKRISEKTDSRTCVLNIVETPGEVPVQMNGQILDNCTEFDLSGYIAKQKKRLDQLEACPKLIGVDARKVMVGDPLSIIRNYIKDNKIDIVFSGAHLTTRTEEVFHETFASRIMEELKVPYLSIKCDRHDMNISKIAMVREFKAPKKVDLRLIKYLQSAFNAEIVLSCVVKRQDEREKAQEQMQKFVAVNELENATHTVVVDANYENGIKRLVIEQNISILAVKQFESKRLISFF